MSKISRALEKAQKERAEKMKEPLVSDTVSGTVSDTNVSQLKPLIHDPELVRIKVRRRSAHHPSVKKKKQIKMMFMIVFALIALLSILAYIYIQINHDPFEMIDTGGGVVESELVGANHGLPVNENSETTMVVPYERSVQDAVPRSQPTAQSPNRAVVVEKVAVADAEPTPAVAVRTVVREPVVVPLETSKVIASFDSGLRMNEIGGTFISWTDDARYPCNDIFNNVHARMGRGNALKLAYNVESTGSVRNGLSMDLASIPVEKYSTFSFYMKGDLEGGFTTTVVVALESSHRKLLFGLNNVTYRWEKVSIPLKDFNEPGEMLKEFRFMFQSDLVTKKTGAVFIDDIELER